MLTYQMIWDFLIISSILCIPLGNLKIFSVVGAGFKIMHVIIILAILMSIFERPIVKKNRFYSGVLLSVLPLFQLLYINDFTEWAKTYFVYILIVFFVVIAWENYSDYFNLNKIKYTKIILNVIAFTQILGVIQFVLMNFFNIFWLNNIFGSFQYTPNQYEMHSNFYRAYSLFLEPSFFGWVCNIGLAILFFCKDQFDLKKTKTSIYMILDLAALFCTLSTSAILFFIIIIVSYLVVGRKLSINKIITIIICIIMFMLAWNFTSLFTPLKRLSTISSVGTSGYQRTAGAFEYVKATMKNFPIFGRGMGQEGNVDVIGIIGKQSGIHNSLAGIVATFGLTSIVYYTIGIYAIKKRITYERNWFVLFVAIMGMYTSTGSFVSLDTFIYVILIFMIGDSFIYENSETENKQS